MSVIGDILESVEGGDPLTPAQYEVLATGSEDETVQAVGEEGASVIEAAYQNYVAGLLSNP